MDVVERALIAKRIAGDSLREDPVADFYRDRIGRRADIRVPLVDAAVLDVHLAMIESVIHTLRVDLRRIDAHHTKLLTARATIRELNGRINGKQWGKN